MKDGSRVLGPLGRKGSVFDMRGYEGRVLVMWDECPHPTLMRRSDLLDVIGK